MRTLLITLASAALTSCIVANAFYQKKQFYPSVIYITRSNSSMSVIYLQAFICVLLIGKLFRFIFFGELRATETENLIERSWHAISETCLAFTVFRDDLNPKFVALFTLLLFLKCFHWLAEDRVDFMERSPNISLLFHFRIASLLFILGLLDIMFISFAYHSTMLKGASVQLVFGFEYAILLAVIITIVIKYLLHRYDLEQRDIPWENKGVYLLYFELLVGLYKVVLYLSFIGVMARIHSFPLFAVRPMYLSVKAFQKALNDVILSRRAIRNMNTLYPNATPEELASVDNVCIICREEMVGNGTAKKLPCNHIFHVSCLRSWFQRQQTCPTCRMNILTHSGNNQQQNNQPQQNNNQQNNQNNANQNTNNNQTQQPAAQQTNQQINQQQLANQVNVNHLRFLFGNLNFADYVLQHPDRQQPQRSAGNASDTNASNTNASSNAPNQDRTPNRTTTRITNATVFPPPPFMGFSFMPFLPFPPTPLSTTENVTTDQSSNLTQLSEEELRRLEGNERAAIEARIRLLQNLRTSIDAIVLQFQQYNQLIVRSANDSRTDNNGNLNANNTNADNNVSSSSVNNLSPDHKDANLRASTSKLENENKEETKNEIKNEDKIKATTSRLKENNEEDKLKDELRDKLKDKLKDKSLNETNFNENNVDEESNLVRQLRLRKFNNQQASSDSDVVVKPNDESKKD